jgi:hypothetical protein
MRGIGIEQNPMFGDGSPGGLAFAFPDYGAGRVVIDGAFSSGFHGWGELALALGWLAVLGLAVAWVLRRELGTAVTAVPAHHGTIGARVDGCASRCSTAAHQAPDRGHQLVSEFLRLALAVTAEDAVARVTVEQAERDLVQRGLAAEICVRTSMQ